MRVQVLFRDSLAEEGELDVCRRYFDVVRYRSQVESDCLVVPRYSSLPYHSELEFDVKSLGGRLINTSAQHEYIADLKNWYEDLKEYTPKTYFRLEDMPRNGGPFVLKGQTNSKKHQWHTHMFAENFQEAMQVSGRLFEDSLIASQEVYARDYIELARAGVTVTGAPQGEEYRFFSYKGSLLAAGFYWSEIEDPERFSVPSEASAFAAKIASKIADKAPFVVIDVARTANNDWIVIELNDGCMSGLSMVNPDELYKNLKIALNDQ